MQLFAANAAAARKELDQLVEDMRLNETAQAGKTLDAKSQRAEQAVLRRNLVNNHMRPGFKALQVPKVGVKAAVLVQDATAMAEAAKEYQAGVRGKRPSRKFRRRAVGGGGGGPCVD